MVVGLLGETCKDSILDAVLLSHEGFPVSPTAVAVLKGQKGGNIDISEDSSGM